jgi:hypothetical protein
MDNWINIYVILGILVILISIIVPLYQRSIKYKPDKSVVTFVGCVGIAGFVYLILSDTHHIL